jgi:membrane protein EpsK
MDRQVNNRNKFGVLQFIKNVGTNVGLFIVNTIISFWFTPYLIRSLGSELYGFIPLVTSVVNYFGIITLSLNASTGRYLMIEVEKKNVEKSNIIFNTSLVSIITMIFAAIPLGALLVFYAADIFQVPIDNQRDIQYLMIGTILAFFLKTLRSGFSIATYTQNRFDLSNILAFLGRLGQIGIVISLFTIDHPHLIYAGMGIVVVSLISFLGDLSLSKKLLPNLKINLGMFSRDLFKEMVGTNFWMLINRFGYLLFMNIEMIVANRFLALSMAGMYGALLTIPNNLRTISHTVSGIWGPLILSKYSRDDLPGIDRVAKTSIKMIGLSTALPIGFFCGVSGEFLGLWLGVEFKVLSWVAVIMALNVLINTLTLPLFSIYISMNRVKTPAVVTCLTGIIYFAVSVVFTQWFGPLGLAAAGGVVLSFRNVFFVSIYSAILLKKKWWHYLINLILPVITSVVIGLASYGFIQVFTVENFFDLIVAGCMISVIYIIYAYFIGLSTDEKESILNTIFRRMDRISY